MTISASLINAIKIPSTSDLLASYTKAQAKEDLSRIGVPAVVDAVCARFRDKRALLVPGRSPDDQKLKQMGLVQNEVRVALELLAKTGRLPGELPADLPHPDQYSNTFAWLTAHVQAIKAQAADSVLLKNPTGLHGYEYPEWHKHLTQYSQDLPELFTQLASSMTRSDFGRDTTITPTYYESWQPVGVLVHELLFAKGRGAALGAKLLDSMPQLISALYWRQPARECFEAMQGALLSATDADALVVAGWTAKHTQALEAACSMSGLISQAKGRRPATVSLAAFEFNCERLGAALKRQTDALEEAEEGKREQARLLEERTERKAKAQRIADLMAKLDDDTITREELQELDGLQRAQYQH